MRLQLIGPTAAVLTMLCGAQAFAGPVVVQCAPGQHAIGRHRRGRWRVDRGQEGSPARCRIWRGRGKPL